RRAVTLRWRPWYCFGIPVGVERIGVIRSRGYALNRLSGDLPACAVWQDDVLAGGIRTREAIDLNRNHLRSRERKAARRRRTGHNAAIARSVGCAQAHRGICAASISTVVGRKLRGIELVIVGRSALACFLGLGAASISAWPPDNF